MPLHRITQIVNVILVGLTLLLNACSKQDAVLDPVHSQDIEELNAVWATEPTPHIIRDIAVAGGSVAMIAAVYEYGGMQIYDFNGDQISDIAPLGIQVLSNGKVLRINDRNLIVFFGVATDSTLNIYSFGSGLNAPVKIDFPVEIRGKVLGVCLDTETTSGSDARIAYWTTLNPLRPVVGKIFAIENKFIWSEEYSSYQDEPFGSCFFSQNKLKTEETGTRVTEIFSRVGILSTLTLTKSGRISSTNSKSLSRQFIVREGITIKVPTQPTSLTALANPSKGGYPNGAILIAGETSPNNSQIIFIDAGPILGAQ